MSQNGTGDYLVFYDNNIDVGTATVIVTGDGEWMGTVTKEFEVKGEWNLFEHSCDHTYSVSGISAEAETKNSNKNSSKYFNATLSGNVITVKLKENADRKKAAGANTFEFDLGAGGIVSYTLPFTYFKPVLKLSDVKGTVKIGLSTALSTNVLCQTENGDYQPYDLSGVTVKYGDAYATADSDGTVTVTASGKASYKLVISGKEWNEKDPVSLKYTVAESKSDVLAVDLGGQKQVTLNIKAPDQSFTFPLTLNSRPVYSEDVEILQGKMGEEALGSIGGGIDREFYDCFSSPFYGEDGGSFTAVFSGLLSPVTGADILLSAMELTNDPNIRLEVTGLGELEESFRQASREDKRIIFKGLLPYLLITEEEKVSPALTDWLGKA